jgi:ATP-dependent protease ClpP protease subunit
MAEMFGESQPVFSANMVREFLDLNPDAESIILEVRSDGGSTSEARIIYDMLRNSGKKIITEGYRCNSSAMILFLAGDERLISENSDNIIHPVWIDAYSLPFALEAADLRLFADEIEKEQVKLLDIYVSVIGDDKRDEVQELMNNTTNLSSDQAINLGFATGMLSGVKAENSNRAATLTSGISKFILNKRKTDSNFNNIAMNKIETMIEGLKNSIEKMSNSISSPEINNASLEMGGEDSGFFYFEGDLEVGTMVYFDEEMTEAIEDQVYVMVDGRKMTVESGAVTEIVEAPEEEEEEANQYASINSRIDGIENGMQTIADSLNLLVQNVESQNKNIEGIKNAVPASTPDLHPTKKNKAIDSNASLASRVVAVSR